MEVFNITAEKSYPTPFANSVLLPAFLLSLATQKHTPTTKTKFRDEYDFVIVGAGSAGSTLAGRLSELPCSTILLVEAGKPPPKLTDVPRFFGAFLGSDIDWNYAIEPQKHAASGHVGNRVSWYSGKTIGGTSVINAMFHVRGNRKDYDGWAAQGADGWSYEEVLPYFKKLERNVVFDNKYHGTTGPIVTDRLHYASSTTAAVEEAARELGYSFVDSNGERQTGFFDIQANLKYGQRCSTAKAYLVPAENRTNLDIVAEAFVAKVLIEDGQATGIMLNYRGKQFEIGARREVILSAGAVNSAKLLMLSGIGPRKHLQEMSIPVVSDLPVGLNFQDHVGSHATFEINEGTLPPMEPAEGKFHVDQYMKRRIGPLAVPADTTIAFLPSNGDLSNNEPDYQLFIENTGVISEKPFMNLKTEVYDSLYGPYINKSVFTCSAQVLHPRSRGTVRLRSPDPYDPPIIDPNYFEDPQDLDDVVQGLKFCLTLGKTEALRKLGVKPLRTTVPECKQFLNDEDELLRCQGRSVIFSTYHLSGTAKMGRPEDPDTVVDSQLKVKGIRKLRVVDASVMPLVTSGNTNVPTIMIAEKAADLIKDTVNCPEPASVCRATVNHGLKYHSSMLLMLATFLVPSLIGCLN